MKLKQQLLVLVALCFAMAANAQEVVQGVKLPRLTTIERDLIQKEGDPDNPFARGQVIFNLDNACLEFWNSTEWVSLCDKTTYDLPIIPECKVKSTLTDPPYNGWITFMCYNLGADSTMTIEQQMAYESSGNTDATVYGDCYQWGRPADGHQLRTSGTTTMRATTDTPNHPDFIITPTPPDNWHTHQNDTLWNSTKTANDPCPAGWRVPTKTEWDSAFENNTWIWNSSSTPGYLVTPIGDSQATLFLPAAGFRYGEILGDIGEFCYYWSSTTAFPSAAFNLTCGGGIDELPADFQINIQYKRDGGSVRCVADY